MALRKSGRVHYGSAKNGAYNDGAWCSISRVKGSGGDMWRGCQTRGVAGILGVWSRYLDAMRG